MPYTIGEVARMMNIAPSTLRYYEKEGLLSLGAVSYTHLTLPTT